MICIDTNVLIWGVQGIATASQEGMIGRTRKFLNQLTRDNEQIMVPADVVGEYLKGFPPGEQQVQFEALSNGFYLPAYDARCAMLAAQLESVGPPKRGLPGVRSTFKADTKIIATAISHGASKIVTGNLKEYRRIAGNRIPVVDVPETWEQADLLDDSE